MEESKQLQGLYTTLRIFIYISVVVEFFEYAVSPEMLEPVGNWLVEIHERMGRWMIYQAGHMPYSKLTTLLLVIVCCIGTKNKKQIEYDARKMVLIPIGIGVTLIILSVWLYLTDMMTMQQNGSSFPAMRRAMCEAE